MQINIVRRKILGFGVLALVSPHILQILARDELRLENARLIIELHIGQVFTDLAAAIAIGHKYFEKFPDEATRERLSALVTDNIEVFTAEEFYSLYEKKMNSDYLNSDLVFIDGWYLTRTEARMCAFACFINS